MVRKTAPFGAWSSPVSPAHVAGKALRFGKLAARANTLLWSESRPAENGRTVIVERGSDGKLRDLTPEAMSARSRVHEYGGGEFAAIEDGFVFVNGEDQDLYFTAAGGATRRLTQAADMRFADPCGDPVRRRIIAVGERHREGAMPENLIAAIALEGAAKPEALIEGADFYAYPTVSPDGTQLTWIEWDLPHMPWEDARLCIAGFGSQGAITDRRVIAGGKGTSVFQPQWREDGALLFVWNPGDFGNLHLFDGHTVSNLCPMDAEFARPLWGLGASAFAPLPDGRIAAAFIEDGEACLGLIAGSGGPVARIDTGYRQIDGVVATAHGVAALATHDTLTPAVIEIDLRDPARPAIARHRDSGDVSELEGAISRGRHVSFPGFGGRTVHALYYPPQNARYAGPHGTLPPAIVSAHGGPTGMADRGFKPKIQYWTSRGFAFLDVDYTGSFGYGRTYREALNGRWGEADVEDVAAGARWLASEGLADPDRLLISGSSAGGYTVLQALCLHDLFAAGAAYYGISDVARLAALTHKFESGYTYTLFGAAPDKAVAVFNARSPLAHAETISSPVIFFQGLDDAVVPPEQSRAMADSLLARKVPVAYLEFEGEGHGFRRAETVERAIQAEQAFYARVLGLEPADDLPMVEISNAERLDESE